MRTAPLPGKRCPWNLQKNQLGQIGKWWDSHETQVAKRILVKADAEYTGAHSSLLPCGLGRFPKYIYVFFNYRCKYRCVSSAKITGWGGSENKRTGHQKQPEVDESSEWGWREMWPLPPNPYTSFSNLKYSVISYFLALRVEPLTWSGEPHTVIASQRKWAVDFLLCLFQWPSERGPWTSSISTTWVPVRNASSQVQPQTSSWLRNSGAGPSMASNKPSRRF